MNRTELRNAYKSFFIDSLAGKNFIDSVRSVLETNVGTAMDDNSLEHLCRAKGNREVIDHIESVISETKKGSLPRE